MQDEPGSLAILEGVIQHLAERGIAGLEGRALFEMRVAIRSLELVARSLALTPQSDQAERERLKRLLGADGDLRSLNDALSAAIRSGAMGPDTPGLLDHLCQTSIEKLAVDQPSYGPYRRAIDLRGDQSI